MSEIFQAFSAVGTELEKTIMAKALQQLKLGRDDNTFDLFPFFSILVTAGKGFWNKNFDVFEVAEAFKARHSPKHKQVNLLHDCGRIVGHIVDVIAVNADDLKPIPEDTDEGDLPYKLHLVTASVIYKYWDNPKLQAEVNDIINGIIKGEWAVSMECLFKHFDYALMDAQGNQKFIPRNKQTNSLTRSLRQYGGPGKLHDYAIGRLLRQITFSGVGLVRNPANPDSIISDNLNIFTSAETDLVYTNLDNSKTGDLIMAENANAAKDVAPNIPHDFKVEDHPMYKNLMDKHERLTKDHADLNQRASDMKSKLDHIHEHTMAKEKEEKDALKKEVADLKEALASKDKEKEDMEKDYASTKASVEDLKGKNDAMQATIDAYKKAERCAARVSALMKVDTTLTREKAEQTVATLDELSDGSFTVMLETVANWAKNAPKEITPEKVLSGAKAEEDAQYGVTNVDNTKTTAEAVKAWWSSGKSDNSTK